MCPKKIDMTPADNKSAFDYGFIYFLKIPLTDRLSFLLSLSKSYQEEMIQNGYQLCKLLDILPGKNWPKVLNCFGGAFLRDKIQNLEQVSIVLKKLENFETESQRTFLELLGQNFLFDQIKDGSGLFLLLKSVAKKNQLIFLKLLGHDFVWQIAKKSGQLVSILNGLQEHQMNIVNFLQFLGTTFLSSQIEHGLFVEVLNYLRKDEQLEILRWIGAELLCKNIKSEKQLTDISSCLAAVNQPELLKMLGQKYLVAKIKNQKVLDDFLNKLPKENLALSSGVKTKAENFLGEQESFPGSSKGNKGKEEPSVDQAAGGLYQSPFAFR